MKKELAGVFPHEKSSLELLVRIFADDESAAVACEIRKYALQIAGRLRKAPFPNLDIMNLGVAEH